MEYYIHNVPVFVIDPPAEGVDLSSFCQKTEEYLSRKLLNNIEVIYIGNFEDLNGRNAAYSNGAIYMTANEPTNFDMLENFIHEVAHSLEVQYGEEIYSVDLQDEFLGKRNRLYYILNEEGFHIDPILYTSMEYNEKFDDFLANKVGYPTLVNLTMGLFVSPYAATSIQEYFANGFEKYFLDSPRTVQNISPILYKKIEEIINDEA